MRPSKEKIVRQYKSRYFNIKNLKKELKKKEYGNEKLINKWIIGRPKNPYYPKPEYEKDTIRKDDAEYYALLDWLLPKFKYNYSQVPFSKIFEKDNYKIERSSIIPYYIDQNGKMFWLLNSFHDYPFYNDPENLILGDIGGKCEQKDKEEGKFKNEALNCAVREFNEETRDVLKDKINILILLSEFILVFEGRNDFFKKKIYFFFVKFKYDDIKDVPEKFRQTEEKRENLGDVDFYPSTEILNRNLRTSRDFTGLINYLTRFN